MKLKVFRIFMLAIVTIAYVSLFTKMLGDVVPLVSDSAGRVSWGAISQNWWMLTWTLGMYTIPLSALLAAQLIFALIIFRRMEISWHFERRESA